MPPGVRNWEIVIALAIAISVHSLLGALDGAVAPATAIVRLVLAGFVSWAAVAVLERLWISYSNAARQRQLVEYMERQNAGVQTPPHAGPDTRSTDSAG